jgi:hypothetical protein
MKSIIPKINSKDIHPLLNKIMKKLGSIEKRPDVFKYLNIESIEYISDFFSNYLTITTLTDIYYIQSKSFGLHFSIKSKKKPSKPVILSLLNADNYTYNLTGNDELDQLNINKLLKEVGEHPVDTFNFSQNEICQLFIEHNEINVINPDICRWFIKDIGLQLGAISMNEYRKIKDEIPFENNSIINTTSSSLINHSFEKSFNLLKNLNYTEKERFEFNDSDNEAFFVEKADIKAVVHISQNYLFITAQNTTTGVLKVWLAMQIDYYYPLIQKIKDGLITSNENTNDTSKIDVIKYIASIADNYYGYKYNYPVYLNGSGFLQSYDFYIDNFNYDGKDCIYNSENGFNPFNLSLGAIAEYDIQFVYTNLCEMNDFELEPINDSSIPINSVEYFFRTCLFEESRSMALHYLFMGSGTGFYWDGIGFSKYEILKRDLPPKKLSVCYSPLDKDTRIDWKLFVGKIPDQITGEWRQALFEFIFYVKEFGETYPENKSYIDHKDNIIAHYNNYYDKEVVDRIKNSRI